MEKTKKDLQSWMMLRDASDDMLEEVENYIQKIEKELKRTLRKQRKEELTATLNVYKSIKQQITENAFASNGQIASLKEVAKITKSHN